MALFIMAMTINPGAKRAHPDLSNQINASINVFSTEKVKVQQLYATLGRYDYVAVFEADDQSIAFRTASRINAMGILETETWPIIPYDDFSRLIQ